MLGHGGSVYPNVLPFIYRSRDINLHFIMIPTIGEKLEEKKILGKLIFIIYILSYLSLSYK